MNAADVCTNRVAKSTNITKSRQFIIWNLGVNNIYADKEKNYIYRYFIYLSSLALQIYEIIGSAMA